MTPNDLIRTATEIVTTKKNVDNFRMILITLDNDCVNLSDTSRIRMVSRSLSAVETAEVLKTCSRMEANSI